MFGLITKCFKQFPLFLLAMEKDGYHKLIYKRNSIPMVWRDEPWEFQIYTYY